MNLHTHRTAWMCWSVVIGVTLSAHAQTSQPAQSKAPNAKAANDSSVGYVKGNNVYVRSGFHTNYYPVTKLNRGDEVKIVGEDTGWLEIVAPAGTFSLVDKTYVDLAGNGKGIINGRAQVYAGSNLEDRRYAKQVKLAKGAEVNVIGETSDGAFYKITPPKGAHLWIKADLVDRTGSVPPSTPGLELVKPGELNLAGTKKPAATPAKAAKAASAAPDVPSRTVSQGSVEAIEKYQLQINAIEAEIQAESARPLAERRFEGIIAKLQPIAEQTEDEVSQLYAQTRIEQVKGYAELAGAVQDLRNMTDKAIDNADAIARQRARIRANPPAPLDDIVIRGEIRVSGIYDGAANRPKRWRVVDPVNNRTQAYIEVPEGSPVDPVQYYGKYIGIRASGYRILKDSVQPLPVYTVKEIVIQDRAGQSNMPGMGMQASHAVPIIVAPVPASQPSAADRGAPTTKP